ncbi:unnamed protein product [Rotaria sp. Silwood1]|nr:unnamed protein product [Rotaria sp. Silwood1]CAF0965761.1 unnamed protein product [Rotaria sp. Silwood1]
MALQISTKQDSIFSHFNGVTLPTGKNQDDVSNDILSKYGTMIADIGYTYHTTVSISRFWLNGFVLREKLHQSLTEALNKVKQNNCESKIRWQQHQNLQEEIKINCTNYLAYFQSEYASDCHYEIQKLSEQCFGDNCDEVDIKKINELMKQMDTEMIKQFENSLWQQVYGAIYSLIAMGFTLRKTCSQIKLSKTYRESDKLRLSIKKVEEYIEESESYIKSYAIPTNKLSDLVQTKESYSSAWQNLKYGRISINFAKRELDMILLEIDAHSQSIEQSRDNHIGGTINNVIRLIGNGIQFMQTPTAILTSTALMLYGTITGMEITTIAGHTLGIYWSQEEINKLNELKDEINKLQENINNIFSIIELIEEKLTHLRAEEKIN